MSSNNRNNNSSNYNSNSNSNSASGGSSGDGFWAKNGPGIMSATGSVISTTYKAGKYVAKSGISAGKSHYNSQKGRSSGVQEAPNETEEEESSYTPNNSFRNPDSFYPPPLRPGQAQYQRGGKLVEAGETPAARPYAQPQQHSANGMQPQQYFSNGAPQQQYTANGASQQQNYGNGAPQQQNYGNGAPQQRNYGNGAPQQQFYGNGASQQQNYSNDAPQQQFAANGAPQQQNYNNSAPQQQYATNTAPPQQQNYGNGAPQQQYAPNGAPQQQFYGNGASQQQNYSNDAPQQQFAANGAPQQQNYNNSAPQQQYATNTAPPQQQNYGNGAPQQQNYNNSAPQQQYAANTAPPAQYAANTAPSQQYPANTSPQHPQVPIANASPQNSAHTSAAQNLQPLYDAQGAVIGYIPGQNQFSSSNVLDSVHQRPAAMVPQEITHLTQDSIHHSSAPIPQRMDFSALPPRTNSQQHLNGQPPSIPQRNLSELTPDIATSFHSGSPYYETKPYEYVDPEEREKSTKIVIESKIDVTKMPPPPMHMGRASSSEKKLSELVDEKIKAQSSTINTYSGSPLATSRSSRPNVSIPDIDSEEEDSSLAVEKKVSVAPKLEIKENDTTNATESSNETSVILGKYDYSKKVEFQPPPKASIPQGFVSPSARLETMKQESENKRQASNTSTRQLPQRPSSDRGKSASSASKLPSVNSRVGPQASTPQKSEQPRTASGKADAHGATKDTAEHSAVSGNYDYSKKIEFQPPPMAKRSERDMEFIQQRQGRSRMSSNNNSRQPKTQTQAPRRMMTMLEPETYLSALPQEAAPAPNPPVYSRNYGDSKMNEFLPPPKPTKPSQLNASSLPPKPIKPSQISASAPPPKPSKPGMLKAPPKPKKPSSIQVEKSDSDDNPFARYDPKSAV